MRCKGIHYWWCSLLEAERIIKNTTHGVMKALKTMFVRYGKPDVLISNNGLQFDSAEFATFQRHGNFNKTASPRYPQSNGKVENAVKTIKRLIKKSHESGQSEYLAPLDWCNMPSEGFGTSPSQCFHGQCCKILLPITGSVIHPHYPEEDTWEINFQKHLKFYYKGQIRHLKPLYLGKHSECGYLVH